MYGVFVVLGGAKFGFSWVVAVSLRKPPIMGVGFPWILSSELRLFNALRGKTREKLFSPALPTGDPKNRSLGRRRSEDCHRASLIGFLILCNQLSPEWLDFEHPNPSGPNRPRAFPPRFRSGV
jgi:hypothetical protein